MIITVTTVVVFVLGLLSLGLAMYGGYVSLSITEGLEGNQEERHAAEQRYYLLGMIGIIVLTTRLLNVPIFFWMLQSLVPHCPGAMCAYGVVNVAAPYSTISIILKMFLPFIYGLWLVVEIANRNQPELPFTRYLARSFLLALFPLVLIDSALDVGLVAMIRPIYAPCCSSAYDVNPPFSPSSIFGPEFGLLVIAITVTVALVLIVVQWFEGYSAKVPLLTGLLCCVVALLYLVAIHDTYAPLVLGLPTHHCPYCLFQEFPDTAFFSGLFWVGVASAGWRIILEAAWKRKGLPLDSIRPLSGFLLKVSSVAILFSMVSMVSHLSLVL
ncbi:MAG: hypothetical protein KAU89_02125 [Candidatus Thorarchaeota archaeon]|jgi:hypothetical protein|nr:hypothetical protein [Candidatus Thorarchaeota archaeon]